MQISLKEKRATEKAQKQAKQQARANKSHTPKQHHLTPAQISRMMEQRRNIEKMRYGTAYDKEELLEIAKDMYNKLDDLVYCRNLTEITGHFEKLLRNLKVVNAIWLDNDYADEIETAIQAHVQEPQTRNQSPNQRRELLIKPLETAIAIMTYAVKELPTETLTSVALYGTGLQIQYYCEYFKTFPSHIQQAVFQILQGRNYFDVFKQYKQSEKEYEFKKQILNATKCLYRIAECDKSLEGIPPPDSIHALRHKKWRLIPAQYIDYAIAHAKNDIIKPFEEMTGFALTVGQQKRQYGKYH